MQNKSILFVLVSLACTYASARSTNATYVVDGNSDKDQYRSHVTLESVADNSSVISAYGAANLNLTGVKMNKTAGRGNALDVSEASKVTVFQCDLKLHASNTNGIAAAGNGTVVKVDDGKITMSKEQSSGFLSTDSALIRIDKFEIGSFAKQSPALSTERNGIIEAVNLTGSTKGNAAPLFSSKGSITVSESRMEACSAPIGHIRDNGTMTLKDCELTQGASCGFFISEGKGKGGILVMDNCKLKLQDGPLLLIDEGNITASFTNNSIAFCDDVLLYVKGGSADITATKQKLNGNIVADSVCTVALTLCKGASLHGNVNPADNAEALITVMLENDASWSVYGDSHLSVISFQQGVENAAKQIKGKGNVYYDAQNPANSYLEGRQYKLGGHVMLIPE